MTLQKHLQGVEPDPPTGEDNDNLDPASDDLTPDDDFEGQGADPGDDDGGDDDGDGKGSKGRTAENVHREMSRKFEQERKERQQFQERMLGMFERLTENFGRPEPAKPDNQNGDSLSNLTVTQLKNMRAQVPAEQKAAFEEYLVERMVDEQVEAKVGKTLKAQNLTTTRKQVAQEAVNLYPDLADNTSEFYQKVDKELRQRGEAYANNNPHAVLDVAAYVAARTGVVQNVRNRAPGAPASKRNAPPAKKQDDGGLPVERANSLASALQGALPKGKKFNIDKVRKASKVYLDNAELFVK